MIEGITTATSKIMKWGYFNYIYCELKRNCGFSLGNRNFIVPLQNYRWIRIVTVSWCNGNTKDSGPFVRGSNPCETARVPLHGF